MAEHGASRLGYSQFDLTTFTGRLQHYARTTNPLNSLASTRDLEQAKALVEAFEAHREPAGTALEDVWRAKYLRDSAFHPQTGELQPLLGRLSSQLMGNSLLTAGMLTFYRSVPAVMFWQTLNQSFNALVNYSNRNASNSLSDRQLLTAYLAATASATGTALGFNFLISRSPKLAGGLVGRLVPFAAVAAANAVNIPLMRQAELSHGIHLYDEQHRILRTAAGQEIVSAEASKKGIAQTFFSRVFIAIPGMVVPAMAVNHLARKGTIKVFICSVSLIIMVPVGCSIFPQIGPISVYSLESSVQQQLKEVRPDLDTVYFQKGL